MPTNLTRSASAGLLLLLASAPAVLALDCFDYSGTFPIAVVDAPTASREVADIVVVNGYAYLTSGSTLSGSGLAIIDVSNPSESVLVGELPFAGSSSHIAIDNGIAYISAQAAVYLIDISDPTQPTLLASLDTTPIVTVPFGNLLYVGTLDEILIVDISVPETPTQIGSLSPGGGTQDLSVQGSVLFALNIPEGLQAFDLTTPELPSLVGSVPLAGEPQRLDVNQGHAYVASGSGGLSIVDIQTPVQLTVVATVAGFSTDISVVDDRAYLLSDAAQVLDISTPSTPAALPGDRYEFFANCIFAESNFIYYGEGASNGKDALFVFSLPFVGQDVPTANLSSPAFVRGTVAGDYIYASTGVGFKVVDVSTRNDPTVVGTASTVGVLFDLAVSDDFVYGFTNSKFYAFDVAVPDAPFLAGSLDISLNSISYIETLGRILLFPETGGIGIIDVSVPADPTYLGRFDAPNIIRDVATSGDYAYAVGHGSGSFVSIVDFSDPEAPFLAGQILLPQERTRKIAHAGDYAYVGTDGGELIIIDTAVPEMPEAVGYLDLPGAVDRILIDGTVVYVSNSGLGVIAIDVADPEAPFVIGGAPTKSQIRDLALGNDFLVQIEDFDGLSIWPLQCGDQPASTDPGNPEPMGSLPAVGLLCSPNPLHHHTVLSFNLAADSAVFLDVYDATGRLNFRRELGELRAGHHEFEMEASELLPNSIVGFGRIRTARGESESVRLVRVQ